MRCIISTFPRTATRQEGSFQSREDFVVWRVAPSSCMEMDGPDIGQFWLRLPNIILLAISTRFCTFLQHPVTAEQNYGHHVIEIMCILLHVPRGFSLRCEKFFVLLFNTQCQPRDNHLRSSTCLSIFGSFIDKREYSLRVVRLRSPRAIRVYRIEADKNDT